MCGSPLDILLHRVFDHWEPSGNLASPFEFMKWQFRCFVSFALTTPMRRPAKDHTSLTEYPILSPLQHDIRLLAELSSLCGDNVPTYNCSTTTTSNLTMPLARSWCLMGKSLLPWVAELNGSRHFGSITPYKQIKSEHVIKMSLDAILSCLFGDFAPVPTLSSVDIWIFTSKMAGSVYLRGLRVSLFMEADAPTACE
jgi:hypothetical protein